MPRAIPAGLLAHMQGEATSLVECIRITPVVGSVLAFTDFNENLTVDSTTFLARPGMRVSQASANVSMELDSSQAQGFFKSGTITRADVKTGKFKSAQFERIFVNFDDVSDGFYCFSSGPLGRVDISDLAFQAELIGGGQAWSQRVGFLTSRACSTTWVQFVGDKYCKVDLNGTSPLGHTYKLTDAIDGVTNAITFTVSSGMTHPTGWFDFGRLLWTSGPNDDYYSEIASYTLSGSSATFVLMQAPGSDIATGHGFIAYAGCDREAGTCDSKFDNLDNFRGQPHLAGDIIYAPGEGL